MASDTALKPPKSPKGLYGVLRVFLILTMICAALYAALAAFSLWAGPFNFDVLTNQDESEITMEGSIWALGCLVVQLFGLLFGGVTFMLVCWLTHRLNANLHRMEAPVELMKPFWAWFWHFIPLAGLIVPFRAAKQIWRGTFALADDEYRDDGILTAWWGAWIASQVSLTFGARFAEAAAAQAVSGQDWVNNARFASTGDLAGGLVTVIACILMIRAFGPMVTTQTDLIAKRAAAA